MPDVEIVPRRFSDPAKVMSFFTFYVPVVFFRERRKYRNVPSRWASVCDDLFLPLQVTLEKYFLFVYLRRFGSFDVDRNEIRIVQKYHICVLFSFILLVSGLFFLGSEYV